MPQMPGCAGTSFTNVIYTKLSTLRQGKSLEYVLVYPVDMAVESYKMPEFFEISPLSEAGKNHNFQVTSCHQNDTINVDFAYIESELMSIANCWQPGKIPKFEKTSP